MLWIIFSRTARSPHRAGQGKLPSPQRWHHHHCRALEWSLGNCSGLPFKLCVVTQPHSFEGIYRLAANWGLSYLSLFCEVWECCIAGAVAARKPVTLLIQRGALIQKDRKGVLKQTLTLQWGSSLERHRQGSQVWPFLEGKGRERASEQWSMRLADQPMLAQQVQQTEKEREFWVVMAFGACWPVAFGGLWIAVT